MNRRDFLKTTWSLAALASTGMALPQRARAGLDCTLYPGQTAGPFFFDTGLFRSDITEGRPGLPLRMMLQFLDSRSCEPVPNAVVDVWHSDSQGLYSGYPGQGDDRRTDTSGQTFMRGIQVTDDQGLIEIESIYPGWYPGRVPHVHFKVFLDDRTAATSQLYFPDAVSAEVYTTEHYAARGPNSITLATDALLRGVNVDSVLFDVSESIAGLTAMRTIGIALPAEFTPTATPPAATPTPKPPTAECVGDCSGDDDVTVAELVRGVNIALGRSPIEQCMAFDRDGNGKVSVAELVAAVNSALRGCA